MGVPTGQREAGGASYLAGRNGVLDVEVEAEVDHVEDAVAPQRGGQALVQPPQPKAAGVDDAPRLAEGRGLLWGGQRVARGFDPSSEGSGLILPAL